MISILKENKGLGCRWVGNFQFKEEEQKAVRKQSGGLSLLFRQGEQRGAGIFFERKRDSLVERREHRGKREKKAWCFFDY